MPEAKPYTLLDTDDADYPALLLKIEQDGTNSMSGRMVPEDIPALLRTIASNIEAQLSAGKGSSLTDGAPDAVTEYAITDGSSDKPEQLGDMNREQAEVELAEQRRIWDGLPLALVQRTATVTAWAAAPTAGV